MSAEEMSAEEEDKYKTGDTVKVWSNTDNKWISGTVRSVEDGIVTADYEKETETGPSKMVKSLPVDSKDIMLALASPVAKKSNAETSAAELSSAKEVGAAKAAATEAPAPKAAKAAPPPLETRTDFDHLVLGASLLSAVSGMVNAVAILEMSSTVAHHTGNASHFGRLLGKDGFRFLWLMVAYVVGAGSASYGDCDGDAIFAGRTSDGLLGVASAVATGAALKGLFGAKTVPLLLWAFSQGLQNGITSRFNGLALRTTHMTGALTDAGLILGQWAQAQQRGTQPPSLRKPILFFSCVLSFAAGGFVVSFLWLVLGALAAMAPAAALGALATGHVNLTMIMDFLVAKLELAKQKLEDLKKKTA